MVEQRSEGGFPASNYQLVITVGRPAMRRSSIWASIPRLGTSTAAAAWTLGGSRRQSQCRSVGQRSGGGYPASKHQPLRLRGHALTSAHCFLFLLCHLIIPPQLVILITTLQGPRRAACACMLQAVPSAYSASARVSGHLEPISFTCCPSCSTKWFYQYSYIYLNVHMPASRAPPSLLPGQDFHFHTGAGITYTLSAQVNDCYSGKSKR